MMFVVMLIVILLIVGVVAAFLVGMLVGFVNWVLFAAPYATFKKSPAEVVEPEEIGNSNA